MDHERAAKKIADRLLKGVGLEPQLGVGDLIEMMQEDSNDFVSRQNGVTYMQFAPRMVGVPSGTMVPTICCVLHRQPWEADANWVFGAVLLGPVSMVQPDGKRRFWVELAAPTSGPPRKYKIQALPEHIELTPIPMDWGSVKRTRIP